MCPTDLGTTRLQWLHPSTSGYSSRQSFTFHPEPACCIGVLSSHSIIQHTCYDLTPQDEVKILFHNTAFFKVNFAHLFYWRAMLVRRNSISADLKKAPVLPHILHVMGNSEYFGKDLLWRNSPQVHSSSQKYAHETHSPYPLSTHDIAAFLRNLNTGYWLTDGP